jgi:hypothetical protein
MATNMFLSESTDKNLQFQRVVSQAFIASMYISVMTERSFMVLNQTLRQGLSFIKYLV